MVCPKGSAKKIVVNNRCTQNGQRTIWLSDEDEAGMLYYMNESWSSSSNSFIVADQVIPEFWVFRALPAPNSGSIIDYKTVEPFGCKMSTSLKYWLKSRIKTLGSDGSSTIPEIWVCTRHIPRVGGVWKLFCGGKLLYVGSTFSTPIEGNRKWKYVFMITPKWNSFDNILLSKQSAIKHIFHFVVTFLVLFEKLKYFLLLQHCKCS